MNKIILQSTRDGYPVQTYLSIKDARIWSGVRSNDIRRVLSGERRVAGNYQWKEIEIKDLTKKNEGKI